MSKANGATGEKDAYLQHVSLKNYKSIKDTEIDFKPGLNIIIGKNGVGKTNFVKALNSVLNFKYDELPDSKSRIKIIKQRESITVSAQPKSLPFSIFEKSIVEFRQKFKIEIGPEKLETDESYEIIKQLKDTHNEFQCDLIGHGIPYNNTEFLLIPASLTITSYGAISGGMTKFGNTRSAFVNQYFSNLYLDFVMGNGNNKSFDANYINDKIGKSNYLFNTLNPILEFHSPISEVRINPDFRIENNNFNNEIILTNFSFQFKVHDAWQPFGFLSDGTKRLFYIISEIAGLGLRYEDADLEKADLNIVLLEEPELGIHPHQLHLLMLFIREQSRYKQIIITTHSPQVLDMLEFDELDRIIICHYDAKAGTQLRHLSSKEVHKAKKYMEEEAFLSDYWLLSDLEPAD